MTSTPIVSKATVRQMNVVKQGLHQRPAQADKTTMKHVIRQMGLIQLDSISITARSHYLVMLSRLGPYNRDDLDSLLPERFLFEYWAHAACLIPLEDYPYFEPLMRESITREGAFVRHMGAHPQDTINRVLGEIRDGGAMSSKAFESPEKRAGSWWDWKPAKVALEYLFLRGILMVSHREHFHRYYDLAERVLEGVSFDLGKSLAECEQWMVSNGLNGLGIATLEDAADYYRLNKQPARRAMAHLLENDIVMAVTVADDPTPYYMLTADLPLLHAIEAGEHPALLTTFLSPFDNLIWHRPRLETIFDFYYRVEMYTPAAKRQYGYYVLPVLHRGAIVGRIDPKIERRNRHFVINALHLEPGVVVTDDLVEGLAAAVGEFMVFHHCDSVEIATATAPDLIPALLNAVRN